jgi:hypothetical protein
MLRRIFGPKRDEVMGDWRKLHNEELHNLYSSPYIIKIKSRRMRACSTNGGDEEYTYIGYWRESQKQIPLGRPRRRWVDNIKTDLKERWDGMVWTGSIWLRIGTSGGLL